MYLFWCFLRFFLFTQSISKEKRFSQQVSILKLQSNMFSTSSTSRYNEAMPELCRVCAKKSTKLFSLFGIRKKGLILAEMLAICSQSNIRQTDCLPSNICNQCLSNLEIAFDFYNLVKSSEEHFQQLLTHRPESQGQPNQLCPLSEEQAIIQKHLKVELSEENDELLLEQTRRTKSATSTEILYRMHLDQQDRHSRRMNRLFECFMCKAKLKSYKDTRAHLKQHKQATPYKCKICSMHFSAAQFEIHLCRGQSVQCAYCSESFQTTNSLLNHLQSHKEQHNLHKCTDCSKLFPMLYLLECHQTQHKQVQKPYVCHICDRGFRVNFLLTKHLTTHSDERRKSIENCNHNIHL